jgi:pimeloyl-ACP methyl ester carboxylesterase
MKWKYHDEVRIDLEKVYLKGDLIIPEGANSIVLFSHGSGSSRLSTRNKMVAEFLHNKGFGTLLFDLLTEGEDSQYQNRFNIELLTERLVEATEWLREQTSAKDSSIGYFGASTGAASALNAAAILQDIGAVVSRGGRPDLADQNSLEALTAPTLFIVGSLDHDVMMLNRKAYAMMNCEKRLEVIWGASHLFEEKGTMDEVCELATTWFENHLQPVKV